MIRVLMVGKSEKKMAAMAADMGNDFAITFTQDLAWATRALDGADFDIAILGGALHEADRERLKQTFFTQNPALLVVKGGGPYGRLVAMQARAALTGHHTDGSRLNGLYYANDTVHFKLAKDTRVSVALYREVPFSRLQVTTIYDGLLESGEHTITILRKHRPLIGAPFIFVTADEIEVHQVAGPF